MFNVQGQISGDKLVLTIDLSKEARDTAALSNSGKTLLLASTSGFVRFGDASLNLNCTIKPKKEKP